MATGVNHRATAGYVTDGANDTYSLGEAYPTTRGGVTFGWAVDSTGEARDRRTDNDPRLAGMVFQWGGATLDFRVDLPATGDYAIRLALGDPSNAWGTMYCVVLDNTTTLSTITDTDGTAANEFDDATGANRTAAAWPAGNAALNATFSSTILNVRIGGDVNNPHGLVHVSFVAAGGTTTPPLPTIIKQAIHRSFSY